MARQKEDKKTGNLLASPVANRQAKFKSEQRKKGFRQVNLWMTEAEKIAVLELLDKLRALNS